MNNSVRDFVGIASRVLNNPNHSLTERAKNINYLLKTTNENFYGKIHAKIIQRRQNGI